MTGDVICDDNLWGCALYSSL